MSTAHRQAAFTLLELLVVLVLVSFITTLLIQGMAYVAKVNETFLREGSQRQKRELVDGWFVESVAALSAPEPGDPRGRFRGDALSFEGVTLASMDRREGVPTPFAFRVEPQAQTQDPRADAELIYVRLQADQRWPLIHLAADSHFEYQDAAGSWHADWPPAAALADMLPDAVALASVQDGRFVLSAVQTPKRRLSSDDR